MLRSALALAAIAAVGAQAGPRRWGDSYELASDTFSAVVWDQPAISFWPANEEEPRRGSRNRNWVRAAAIKECDRTQRRRCTRTRLRNLEWEVPTAFAPGVYSDFEWDNVITFTANGTAGIHNFDRISVTYVLGVCPDTGINNSLTTNPDATRDTLFGYDLLCREGNENTIAMSVLMEGHTPIYGDNTDYTAVFFRSRNPDLQTAATGIAEMQDAAGTQYSSPIADESRNRRIKLVWSQAAGVATPQLNGFRLNLNLRPVGAIGVAVGAACAAGALVVLGGLAFRQWKKKDEKEQTWDEVDIALPTASHN